MSKDSVRQSFGILSGAHGSNQEDPCDWCCFSLAARDGNPPVIPWLFIPTHPSPCPYRLLSVDQQSPMCIVGSAWIVDES